MAYTGLRIKLASASATSQAAWPVTPLHSVSHGSSPRGCLQPLQAAASASFSTPFGSPSNVTSLLQPLSPPVVDSFLSRYALGDSLGQGAMGKVVSAIDRVTGEEVAVKVVSKQRNGGRHQRSALHREATLWRKACAATRQAGRFMSVEEDACNYYIVSEKCRGGSLQTMLNERGALSEAELSQVAWCILTFLADMHRHSIYYGDMKPDNVILKDVYPCDSDPGCLNVRVIDFGCSQLVAPGSPLRAMSGSPLFLAPEIIKGSYGLPADMWAFGVTLYYLICNRLPFWLEPVDQLEQLLVDTDSIHTAIQYSPVLFAGQHWRGVSNDLKDLICGLLEKDPARRLSADAAMKHPWFAGVTEICRVL